MNDTEKLTKFLCLLRQYRKVCVNRNIVGGNISQSKQAIAFRSKIDQLYPEVEELIDSYAPKQSQYLDFGGKVVPIFSNITSSYGATMFVCPAIEAATSITERALAKLKTDSKKMSIPILVTKEYAQIKDRLVSEKDIISQLNKIEVLLKSKDSEKLLTSILLEVRNVIVLFYNKFKNKPEVRMELISTKHALGEINVVVTYLKQQGASESQLELVSSLYHLSSKGKGVKVTESDVFTAILGLLGFLCIYANMLETNKSLET